MISEVVKGSPLLTIKARLMQRRSLPTRVGDEITIGAPLRVSLGGLTWTLDEALFLPVVLSAIDIVIPVPGVSHWCC
jgi:hypothetical protein